MCRLWVVLLLPVVGRAEGTALVAQDEGGNYGDQWLGDGGFGLDPWVFRRHIELSGFVTNALANAGTLGLDDIGSTNGNKAWQLIADGTNGSHYMAAFRGFGWAENRWTRALSDVGDMFRIAMENENIGVGGRVGFCLRHDNADTSVTSVTNGERFAFAFIGGEENYSVLLGTNRIDTGIRHRASGLTLEFALTGDDTFDFRVYGIREQDALLAHVTGTLRGTGSIDSVALFNMQPPGPSSNRFFDVFFNHMAIRHVIAPTVVVVR